MVTETVQKGSATGRKKRTEYPKAQKTPYTYTINLMKQDDLKSEGGNIE